MTEVTKYQSQSGLTFAQQIKFSQQHPKVIDAEDRLVHNIINTSIGKCVQMTGFKFEKEEDYDFLLNEMVIEIFSRAKGLRISEIPIAFDRGIKKMYGEWVGLSVVTFTGFIHFYMKDPERLQILKELEPEKKELPPVKYDGTKRLQELREEYKKIGWAEDTGNIVYDWMIEEGIIKVGYGHQFVRQAKEQLLKEQKTKLITELNSTIRQSVTKVLQSIEDNSSNLIVVLAKKLAVNEYIKNENKN